MKDNLVKIGIGAASGAAVGAVAGWLIGNKKSKKTKKAKVAKVKQTEAKKETTEKDNQ